MRWHKGPSPKSLDWEENFKPNIHYFVTILKFVAIYAPFWNLWAKKCFYESKTVFLGQEVHYYMVYIAYYTEFDFKICNDAQNDAFVAKIVNTHLTKILWSFLLLPPCFRSIYSTWPRMRRHTSKCPIAPNSRMFDRTNERLPHFVLGSKWTDH